jgi:HPt (histidine-containing phosphotransfer) domain-containing protein
MTASALTEDRDRCDAAGMDDYLAKPVRREELAAALAQAAARLLPTQDGRPGQPASERQVPAQPPVGDGVLDTQVLQSLTARLGQRGPELVAELIGTWDAETEGRLTELSTAVLAGDGPAVARVAHSLGGGSSALGAVGVQRVCQEVEEALRSGADVDLLQARGRIEAAVAQARRRLRPPVGSSVPGV